MCDSILEGGRRCPCDSSESRRLRLHKNKILKQYGPMAQTATMTETVAVKPETVVDEETINEINSPFSVENLQKQVDTVHNLLKEGNDNNLWASPAADPGVVEWLSKVDEATIQLGLGVEYLAETKFGAPTDLDIKTLSDERDKDLEAKLADLNKQYDEVIAEQSQLFREAIAFDTKRDRITL